MNVSQLIVPGYAPLLGLSAEDMRLVQSAAADAAMEAAKRKVQEITGIDLDRRFFAPQSVGVSHLALALALATISRAFTNGYGIFPNHMLEEIADAGKGRLA